MGISGCFEIVARSCARYSFAPSLAPLQPSRAVNAMVLAHQHRVALCFFGKHGGADKPSREMNASQLANETILRRSQLSWSQHLLGANTEYRFDVFAHSWSPEVSEVWSKLWSEEERSTRGRVKAIRSVHEPTHYKNFGNQWLSFACKMNLCRRTMSAILSIAKVLQLKQEAEFSGKFRYDTVVVARHDLVFASGWRLPLLSSADEVLYLPANCFGRCAAARGQPRIPKGCLLSGMACPWHYISGLKRAWRTNDWLFWSSSAVADIMSDMMRGYHDYESHLRKTASFSAMHYFFSFHAVHRNLPIAFGPLMTERDILMTREALHRESLSGGDLHVCVRRADSVRAIWHFNLSELPHPQVLNQQCMFDTITLCYVKRSEYGNSTCDVAQNNDLIRLGIEHTRPSPDYARTTQSCDWRAANCGPSAT